VATPELLWKLLLQAQTSSQNVTITPTEVQGIIRQIQAFSPVLNAVAAAIPGAAPWVLIGTAFVGAIGNAVTVIQQDGNKSIPEAIVALFEHLTPGQPNAAPLAHLTPGQPNAALALAAPGQPNAASLALAAPG
jgi:hypothetical protein